MSNPDLDLLFASKQITMSRILEFLWTQYPELVHGDCVYVPSRHIYVWSFSLSYGCVSCCVGQDVVQSQLTARRATIIGKTHGATRDVWGHCSDSVGRLVRLLG